MYVVKKWVPWAYVLILCLYFIIQNSVLGSQKLMFPFFFFQLLPLLSPEEILNIVMITNIKQDHTCIKFNAK